MRKILYVVFVLLIFILHVGCQKKTNPIPETKEDGEDEEKITYVEIPSVGLTSAPTLILTPMPTSTPTPQIHPFIDEEGRQIKYKGIAIGVTSVREGPGKKYDEVIIEDKTKLQLYEQEELIILDEVLSDEDTSWYHVIVKRYDYEYTGYAENVFVSIGNPLPSPHSDS